MAEADWRRMEERTLLALVVAMGMGMEEAMEALVAEVVLMVEVVVGVAAMEEVVEAVMEVEAMEEAVMGVAVTDAAATGAAVSAHRQCERQV